MTWGGAMHEMRDVAVPPERGPGSSRKGYVSFHLPALLPACHSLTFTLLLSGEQLRRGQTPVSEAVSH
ncbi:unnamed protein product [Menidia menidia]|uniref:(Atlantic silverside) hypothetical protein n=1 Tax=Menidia menidia TaxID=238744 RepID=A0A8S4BZ78_9TELE|nr:unnamed protein product [Menidia menidia]